MSFFADVPSAPNDPLLSIDGRYRKDARTDKLNLGIGVLRKTDGTSHEFQTVLKVAKQVPVSTFYPASSGDAEFVGLSAGLVFGTAGLPERVMGVQTVGGSGALRTCADLLAGQGMIEMMIPNPSWANHKPLLSGGGLKITEYTYLDENTHTVDIEGMLECLKKAPAKSSVMMQVAAHNPTGVDLTEEQWDRVYEVFMQRRDVFPVFDSAYQGLARGLTEDVRIVRKFLDSGIEFAVCNSHSKNFGLYGERVGSFFLACQNKDIADRVCSRCCVNIRTNYSVPPLFGARIVATILKDATLRKEWEDELQAAREQLTRAHEALRDSLREGQLHDKFSTFRFGLFTQLFLTDEQVLALETDHGVYVAPKGRINVSSLASAAAEKVAKAVVAVVK